MSRLLATVDRFITLIFALALIAGGLWAIGLHFDEPNSQWLADQINKEGWKHAYYTDWFPYAAGAVAVISVIAAIMLISANLRIHRITRVESDFSTLTGKVTYNLGNVASAAGEAITKAHRRVTSASTWVAVDRGRPTMSLTVYAQGTVDVPKLISTLELTEQDIRGAIDGKELDTIYKIHLGRLD